MSRPDDWDVRLGMAIDAAARREFGWGRHDCALAACSIVQAITGTDPAAQFRGRYTTARGALRALRSAGYDDLEAAAAALAEEHGFREIAPALAQRGDLLLADTRYGPALGAVDLSGKHGLFAGQSGAVRISVSAARRAWRVE